MLQLIEKCYLFKEKLPLLLIQDLEHFLDYNCCRCGISRQSVISRINIAISSFPDSLFNLVICCNRSEGFLHQYNFQIFLYLRAEEAWTFERKPCLLEESSSASQLARTHVLNFPAEFSHSQFIWCQGHDLPSHFFCSDLLLSIMQFCYFRHSK